MSSTVGDDAFHASVLDPLDNSVECEFLQLDNGSFRGKFVPQVTGNYKIKILKGNSNVPISQFVHKIADENLGCDASFTINMEQQKNTPASETNRVRKSSAQKYRVDITTGSDTHVDCDFEELSDNKCTIRFVPTTLGEHIIKIFKLGSTKVLYEFTYISEEKIIGQTATFTITLPVEYKPKLTASVTSPSDVTVDCTVEETSDDNWLIQFVPGEIGDHVVKLFLDDSSEPITQFVYTIVDSNGTLPSGTSFVFRVGEPAKLTFNVDGRMVKSESQFSATISSPNKNAVKLIFEELDDETMKVRFVPEEVGQYLITIFKVGNESPISDFTFDAKEEHLEETTTFNITIVQEWKSELSATVTSPTDKEVDCLVEETGEGHCLITFTPTEVGDYTIRIFENNERLPAATIIYTIVDHAYDLSRKLPSEHIFRIGEPVVSTVNVAEAKRKFSATVTSPSNALINCNVEESEDGKYGVMFTPKEAGDYIVRIYQGDNPIPVSQLVYTVKKGEQANFSVNVSSATTRQYSATVTSPSGENLHCRVDETDAGVCRVRFMPTDLGDYDVRLFQDDMEISQFTYKVNDLTKREPTIAFGSNLKDNIDGKYIYINDQVFNLAERISFYLSVEESAKHFSATCMSPRHVLVACDVEERSPDEFVIRFTPKELGDHVIKIYNDDSGIPIHHFIYKVRGLLGKMVEFKMTSFSPEPGRVAYKIMSPPKSRINYDNNKDGPLYEINVHLNTAAKESAATTASGADRCTAEGTGLRAAKVGEVATFEVNTSFAGRGALMVGVEGPKIPAKEISVKHIGEQKYSVNYALDMEGNYSLYVMWGGQHIPGSPFHVTV